MKQKKTLTGLTSKEKKCMDCLYYATKIYVELKKHPPGEVTEFLRAIQKLQGLLGMRVVRRDYPNGWIKKEVRVTFPNEDKK